MFIVGLVAAYLRHGEERTVTVGQEEIASTESTMGNRDSPTSLNQLEDPAAAWTVSNENTVDPALVPKYKERVEEAVLVQITEHLIGLREGDEVSIFVPQEGISYRTKVNRVETALGVTSYSGRLVESEVPRSFLITIGKRKTFANFSTPRASYELVGNNDYAWLMNVAYIDQHVDYSKPDVIIPDRYSLGN